jgi:hypothetical protein
VLRPYRRYPTTCRSHFPASLSPRWATNRSNLQRSRCAQDGPPIGPIFNGQGIHKWATYRSNLQRSRCPQDGPPIGPVFNGQDIHKWATYRSNLRGSRNPRWATYRSHLPVSKRARWATYWSHLKGSTSPEKVGTEIPLYSPQFPRRAQPHYSHVPGSNRKLLLLTLKCLRDNIPLGRCLITQSR